MVQDSADFDREVSLGPCILAGCTWAHEKLGSRFDIEPVHIVVTGHQQVPVWKPSLY